MASSPRQSAGYRFTKADIVCVKIVALCCSVKKPGARRRSGPARQSRSPVPLASHAPPPEAAGPVYISPP
jgi:hypothetical protein